MLKRKQNILVRKSAAVVIDKDTGAPLSDDPNDAERRLTNIRTREVSLVDSAANGRTFLLVKRKDAMKVKDKTLFKGEPKPGAQAAAQADPNAAPGSTPDNSEEVETVEKHFQTISEKILQGVPVAKALAMEQKEMFFAMSDALMNVSMALDFIRSDLTTFAGSDGRTGFMGQEIAKGLSEKEIEEIGKRGKKMKKTRLQKLKSAVDSLTSLMKELEDESENVNKEGGSSMTTKNDNKTVVKPTEEAAAAGSAPASEGQTSEATTQETSTSEAAPAAPGTAETATEKATDKPVTLADLNAAVEKATAPLKAEIETLKNAPAEPAAEGADGTDGTTTENVETKKSLFSGVIY